jgi:hypothetical protein
MDTTWVNSLVVGQIVWMESGPHRQKGQVLWITDKEVGVEVFHDNSGLNHNRRYAFLFDFNGNTGTVWEGLGSLENVGGGPDSKSWITDWPYAPGTEYGPWKLELL